MNSVPDGLTWWSVPDSRSGNTVAWAYEGGTRTAYVAFRGVGCLTPYAYPNVPPETVRTVGSAPYVSWAIAHHIKVMPVYERLASIPSGSLRPVDWSAHDGAQ